MATIERMTAIKCMLKELTEGKYIQGKERFAPNYVENNGSQLSRISTVATVTAVYVSDDEKYAFIVLDDGTATIRSKAFQDTKPFKALKKGDLVFFMGKVREYNDERYLVPEIVKKLEDPNFETLNKLQVLKRLKRTAGEEVHELAAVPEATAGQGNAEETGKPTTASGEEQAPPDPTALRNKVLAFIESNDQGQGTTYDAIIEHAGDEAEKVIQELLDEGSCYEPRPGVIKIL